MQSKKSTVRSSSYTVTLHEGHAEEDVSYAPSGRGWLTWEVRAGDGTRWLPPGAPEPGEKSESALSEG